MDGLDEFRKDVMGKLYGDNVGPIVEGEVKNTPTLVNETKIQDDMASIIKNIVENRVGSEEIEPEGLKEARVEVMANIDWGVMDALFNK